MKSQAEIVIVGGGIYGVSVAYHLAKLGRKDIVLLEKGEIASGESSHAAGLVTQFSTSPSMMRFRKYSIELFSELGFLDQVGSLRVASSRDQFLDLQRSVSRAKAIGLDVDVISPAEALEIMPQLSDQELYGAVYLPQDGQLDPYTTTTSMARLAKDLGVEICTNTRLTGIELTPQGQIRRVHTESGPVDTEIVVNAAGMWAPQVAAMAGLNFPTTPVDHQHIALRAVPGHEFTSETPCLRDPDNLVYMRQEQGGLVIGGYEPDPHARWIDGVPWQHGGTTLPADYDRFEQLLEGAIRRIPFLDSAGIITLVCHPGAYTPDCQPLLGPMAGVKGMWVTAGISLNGYGGAGGIGRLMAEWIVGGEPSLDVYAFRATRFGDYYNDPIYAAERTRESVKYYYRLRFPNDENEWARPHCISPVHHRLQERGAVFGEKFGWERVNYFQPGQAWTRAGADQREWGWNKPPYFDRVAEEHQATRERVTLFDLTSFGKIDLKGPGALPLLQRVADSNIDQPVGRAIYTQFLNTRGGVEADLTITRLGPEHFRVITGSAFIANDISWLRMHIDPEDGELSLRDITMELACLALWGPQSRATLQKITEDDISNEAHPYLFAKPIRVNGVPVLAQRVSYVGELGWELYVPWSRATGIWDAIVRAGEEFGLEIGGYKSLDSLRLEKGYRYYTADVTPLETPYQAGLGFCVDLSKDRFVGKDALVKAKADGLDRKLSTLVLDGEEFAQVYGGEAVLFDGEVISRVRSGGYGHTLKQNIMYAYLPVNLAKRDTSVDLELIEGHRSGRVTSSVLFDPKGDRLRQ